jgi:DNA polymerase-1
MGILETARKAYARIKAESNGHPSTLPVAPICSTSNEINEINEKSPPPIAHRLIVSAAGLAEVEKAVRQSQRVAVDCETTELSPRTGRVRLLTLATDEQVYIIDTFTVDPSPLWPTLVERELILHNAAFDAAFLHRIGLDTSACTIHDTLILSSLLTAGDFSQRNTLEAVAERYLGIALDKSHQQADWSLELTPDMLAYAASDASATRDVYSRLQQAIDTAGLRAVADLEHRCLPTVLWLSRSGVGFDRDAWMALAEKKEREAKELKEQLGNLSPPKPDGSPWNWNSPKQVTAAFAALGIALESTAEETLAAVDHPLADALRHYRVATKLAGTYGCAWLDYIGDDGRIRCTWKQTGAKTGRMACGSPNLQNLPKDLAYRRCFIAPPGRMLIKADYSQIELRIAAKVAGEQKMIEAFVRGEDLHKLTAQQLTGKKEVTKKERDLAKPVNFGLIYGLGAPALARKATAEYGIDLSEKQAKQYRDAWFAAWPGIVRWHSELKRQSSRQMLRKEPAETRTLTGRRTIVKPDLWHGARANFIVQGTGGDGIKLALALLWERRAICSHAFPVLAVHDEIVIEVDEDKAQQAADWLMTAMIDAMRDILDPVPCAVETKISKTWGG